MTKKSWWVLLFASILASISYVHGQWDRIPHPGADFRCVQLSGSSISAVGSWENWQTSMNLGATWGAPRRNVDKPTVIFYTILSVGDRTYIGGSGGSIMTGMDMLFQNTGITSDVLTFADVSDSVTVRILAGTFGEGIIASTDKGLIWAPFGTGLSSPNVTNLLVTRRSAAGSAAQILAATYGGGINRSTDGGVTWMTNNLGLTVPNINQLCSSGEHIFAAGSGGHFFVSHDSADSWENIGGGLPQTEILSLNVLISASDTLCLAGTIDCGVWVRSLAGGSWAARNAGLRNLRINSIAVWDTLVLVGTHEGGYLSADKGKTWNLISKPSFPQIVSMGAVVDPGNPMKTHLFFGSREWLDLGHCPYRLARAFTSSNMGADWQALPFTYARSFPSLFARDSLVIYLRGGAVDCMGPISYVSRDLGRSWFYDEQSFFRGMGGCMKAYEKEDHLGVNLFFTTGGISEGIYVSPDTGRSWRRLRSDVRSIFAVSGMNLYCRYSSGYLRTTDLGNTWQDITENLNGAQIVELETQGTRLFASSDRGLLVSADSAQTWSNVGFGGMFVPVIATHDSLLFVVANGELYYSKDSSLTWANVTANLAGDSVYRVGFSKNHCLVSTSDGRELWYRPLSEILAIPGSLPGAPVLLSPRPDSIVSAATATFTWSKPEFTKFFQFQLSLDSAFVTGHVVDSSGIADTSLVLQELASGVSYFWRVRAYNINGYGVWSSVFSFRTPYLPVGIPVLLAPPDSSLNQPTKLKLGWQRLLFAEKYHLQLWNIVDGLTSFTVNDSAIVDTQIAVDTLRTGTWYSWTVRARNPSGYGMWAPVWHFRTIVSIPCQVSLVFPQHGATVSSDSVRLTWMSTGQEVSRYWFESATDSLFVYRQLDSTVTDTAFVLRGLRGGFSYWWKVKAYNNAGWGPSSETRKFSVTITGIPSQAELPAEYSLSQNYPNPFNPSTSITYQLPSSGHVWLIVYDPLGREVATLVDDNKPAGVHSVQFDTSELSSGVYFCRMQAGDFVQTKRLICIK